MHKLHPPVHIGKDLTDKANSLWVVPWVSLLNPATGLTRRYVMMRDPQISRGGRDDASFVHVPARGLFPAEIETDQTGRQSILLETAVDNVLHYYSGLRAGVDYTPKESQILHREPTALFSGPQENQEVICVLTCLGENLRTLPAIQTIDMGGSYPTALKDKPDALAFCNAYRRHVAFVDLELFMNSLKQRGPVNDLIYSPKHSPFWAKGLEIFEGARFNRKPHNGMLVQGTVLYVMEKAADQMGVPRGKTPNRRQRWITDNHMAQALYNLDGGKYRSDPRLMGWKPPTP